jgi:exodeoxyribonuclease VII large subunit
MSEPEQVLSVSQLTRQVRGLLEDEIGEVWVEGEVSNHRLQTSGHQYFTLKDAAAQLSCVLFKYSARGSAKLADGVQVQVLGKLSVYEPRGQYQLVAKLVQARGQGALQAKFEALKRRLAEEGLFDPGHKKRLPPYPATVALVTSPTGAAVRDMIHVLSRRAPWIRLLVFPVRVQGSGAENEIAYAIDLLNDPQRSGLPPVDCMIVGRGGGSLEDLWNFNEEVVARAIHRSQVPVISAVGHEIDFTIADFVADLRAPTPSAAAELVAPDAGELLRGFVSAGQRMRMLIDAQLDQQAQVVELMARGSLLHEPLRQLQAHEQEVDELDQRLRDAVRERLSILKDSFTEQQQVLARHHPMRIIADGGHRVALTGHRLQQSISLAVQRKHEQTETRSRMLHILGPQSVLARGFSYTTDVNGRVLNEVSDAPPGSQIITRLADGSLRSTVAAAQD